MELVGIRQFRKTQSHKTHSKFKIFYFEFLRCYSIESFILYLQNLGGKNLSIVFTLNCSYFVKPSLHCLLMQISLLCPFPFWNRVNLRVNSIAGNANNTSLMKEKFTLPVKNSENSLVPIQWLLHALSSFSSFCCFCDPLMCDS